MRNHKGRTLLALFCLLVAAAALLLVRFNFSGTAAGEGPGPPPAQSGNAATPPKVVVPHVPLAAPDPVAGSRYTPGAQRSYALGMHVEASLDQGATRANSGDAAAFEISIEGSWVETFVGGHAGIARYHVALTNSKVLADRRPAGALRGSLETPFFVERNDAGAVEGFYFERTTTLEARSILKSAVAMGQVLVQPGHEWKTEERDPTGEYEAKYTRQANPREIRKKRFRYLRLSTARGLRATADVGSAEIDDDTRITLTVDEELERLETKAQTKVRTAEGLPTAAGRLVGSLVLRDRSVDTSKLDEFDRRRAELDRVDMLTKPDVSPTAEAWRESDRLAVGTQTLAHLVAALAKVRPDDRGGRAEAMAKLRADFRLRPEDTAKAAAVVETAAVADGKAITAALGGAGTPEAQRALVAIVDNPRVPLPVRLNASAAVLLLEQPTPAIVGELQRQMNDPNPHIRGASSLALGSVLEKLDDGHRAERDAGMRTLVATLANAPTASERVIALRALGNSADPRVAELAQQAYGDEDLEVRVAAVHAVRLVPGAQADALISTAMLNDRDARVRIQAIDTVTAHRFVPTYLREYDAILSGDKFPLVRRAVVQSLSKASALPQAIALLERAENDPSEDVRVVAKLALQNTSAASP